ncbi:E3 ubiquitin-protein ligase FANCL [Hyalella azteca]|uniref:E3 ubiquitin-protein ligase FANCL n=1 Tax=Hyalella azteca TaxID=294128 RepID=A0A8B7NTL6_HYAAZ|nr:E3 ubiquitin-protein ligase FANCL [Hyalella azteca]
MSEVVMQSSLNGFVSVKGIPEEFVFKQAPSTSSSTHSPAQGHLSMSSSVLSAELHNQKLQSNNSISLQSLEPLLKCNWNSDILAENWAFLFEELQEIGWDRIEELSADLSYLTIHSTCGQHIMQGIIPSAYPEAPVRIETYLPIPFTKLAKKLKECVEAWDVQLEQLRPFFCYMQELDNTALILDPQTPQPQHIHRRLLLENQVFLEVTVSPTSSHSPPHCRFIGPSNLCAVMSSRLSQLYQGWDSSRNLLENIELLLEERVRRRGSETLNAPQLSSTVSDAVECVVCYSFHSDTGELPDLVCDHCLQAMHHSCVYMWLKGLASSRHSMQLMCGDCPYCTKPISCRVPV